MTLERNRTIARHLYEDLWGRGDLSVIDLYVEGDYVRHEHVVDPGPPPCVRVSNLWGPTAFQALVSAWRTGFPDASTSVEDQIAEGEKISTRWVSRGTHRGAWLGVAPTGRSVVVEGQSIDRIVGGHLVETWTQWDVLGLLQQLGAVPLRFGA